MIEAAAMTLFRHMGRLTLVAALGALAACAAIDDGTDAPGDDEIEEIAETDETDRDLAPVDDEVTEAELELENANAAARYWVGDGACHTFDYLRYWSNWYCSQAVYCGGNGWTARAYDRNYTHGCTGWWGAGARYVWFSCTCAVPI